MSKLSRNVLKEIVKECIVEIFEESFFGPGEVLNESRSRSSISNKTKKRSINKRPNAQSRQQHLGQRSSLDTISYNKSDDVSVKNEAYDRKIENITNNLTSDPVMAEIFKDTANSTLQQQMSADSARGPSVLSGGDSAAKKAYNSDPTELFAESASKWATLAFSDSVRK